MIVMKIWGGLGNQLFQYAYGYALSRQYGEELYCDVDFFKKQYAYVGKRRFVLNFFDNQIKVYQRSGLVKVLESFLVNRLIQRVRPAINITCGRLHFVKEKRMKYAPVVSPVPGKLNYYDGYWQSSRYFYMYKQHFRELLLKNWNPEGQVKLFLDEVQTTNSVSVHIRRGDFAKSRLIGHEMKIDYYQKAIQYLQDKYEDVVFYIFSDDLEWVKQNLNVKATVKYADYRCENGEIVDLLMMSKCRHGIMSASTFSWWGSWLKEENELSTIVAPAGEYFNDCFIEKNWVQI